MKLRRLAFIVAAVSVISGCRHSRDARATGSQGLSGFALAFHRT